MTDKELRKLSRLELLELLLEATKENQMLKDTIKKMKIENQTAQSIENLSTATHKVESALKYANSITDTLKGTAKDSVQANENAFNIHQVKNDREIYWRTMAFFSKNNHILTLLPDELKNDISERINEVLKQIRK
jgi:hypothetical protein